METNDIIFKMNELLTEECNLPPTFIDVILDAREDDGLPSLAKHELAELQAKCDAAADRALEIDAELDSLGKEFFAQTGRYPRYIDSAIPQYTW